MKKILILNLSLLFFSFSALARVLPACAQGYHADSAGRGIEAGFKGEDLRPSINDDYCYQLGIDEGKSIIGSDSFCLSDFTNGLAEGLHASAQAGSSCFGKGYLAGLADLHIGAREGNATLVGQACVEEYVKGTADKKSAAGGDPQATGREADCYWAGFYSGI